MNQNKLLMSECIRIYDVDEDFLQSLSESGLIHLEKENEQDFLLEEELDMLEQFVRWHYDMDINIGGIEALHHMLSRVQEMQKEIEDLRNQIRFYKSF